MLNVALQPMKRTCILKSLRNAVRTKEFSLIGQLRLHQDSDRHDVIRQAECLSSVVDAVAVTDCPHGVLHMSGLAVASILIERGIDPVVQISARDRNRIALKSELLGAAALGVTSLILQRGDKLPSDRKPKIKQVFDTGAKMFLATTKQLSDYQAARGEHELFLGTMATVFDPEEDWQPTELAGKIKSGADFVQTQTCLDPQLLRRYMEILVAAKVPWRCWVIASVPVLTSVDAARWLYENSRGAVIPAGLLKRFESANDPESFGIAYCAETIQAIKEIPSICGVNLSTTGDAEAIVAAVKQAGVPTLPS